MRTSIWWGWQKLRNLIRSVSQPTSEKKTSRILVGSITVWAISLIPSHFTPGENISVLYDKKRIQEPFWTHKLDTGRVSKQGKKNKLNATGEFEATFKVSDQVCNTSVWGSVYILESPKWFNNNRENRTEPYTLSNIHFSESSYYIHDSCTVSILPHTNVSSGVIRSTGSSRAKRCRLLHRNTHTSCKKPLLFRIHNWNLCSHFTDRNLPLRIRRCYSIQCAL
jgi:hypothetical protein